MATGLIAYDRLSARDPAAIVEIEALILHHPDHDRFEVALSGLEGEARSRHLFALIARWPDDIRGTQYDHPHWHHQLRVVAGWTIFRDLRLGEADHAVLHAIKLLRDPKVDPSRRAIALCWLMHVVGDMHQPLHAGHRMDGHFPLTDRAGVLGWVRRAPDAAPESLHHFWDTAADSPGDDWAGAEALARIGLAGPVPPVAPDDFKASYRSWVVESEQLAANPAYADPTLEGTSAPHAALLPAGYVADARVIAERRIGEAGARLAELLGRLFRGGGQAEAEQSGR